MHDVHLGSFDYNSKTILIIKKIKREIIKVKLILVLDNGDKNDNCDEDDNSDKDDNGDKDDNVDNDTSGGSEGELPGKAGGRFFTAGGTFVISSLTPSLSS